MMDLVTFLAWASSRVNVLMQNRVICEEPEWRGIKCWSSNSKYHMQHSVSNLHRPFSEASDYTFQQQKEIKFMSGRKQNLFLKQNGPTQNFTRNKRSRDFQGFHGITLHLLSSCFSVPYTRTVLIKEYVSWATLQIQRAVISKELIA